jgi:hypothetical protein
MHENFDDWLLRSLFLLDILLNKNNSNTTSETVEIKENTKASAMKNKTKNTDLRTGVVVTAATGSSSSRTSSTCKQPKKRKKKVENDNKKR